MKLKIFYKTNTKAFTLLEVIIASALSLLLLGVIWLILTKTFNIYQRTSNYQFTQDEGRIAARHLSKDFRNANNIDAPSVGSSGNSITAYQHRVAGETLKHVSGQTYKGRPNYPINTDFPITIYYNDGEDRVHTTGFQVNNNQIAMQSFTIPSGAEVTADLTYDIKITYQLEEQDSQKKLTKKTYNNQNDNELKSEIISNYLSNDMEPGGDSDRYIFSQPAANQVRVKLLFDKDFEPGQPEYELNTSFDTIYDLNSYVYLRTPVLPDAIANAITGKNLNTTFSLNKDRTFIGGDLISSSNLALIVYNINGSWGTSNANTVYSPYKSMWFADRYNGYGVLENGVHLQNSGDNAWTSKGSSPGRNGIWGDDKTNLYSVGTNGIYTKPDPNDNNWVQVYSQSSCNLRSINGKAKKIFAVGDGGLIMSYDEIANQWNQMTSPTSNNLYSVCYIEDENNNYQVWAVGDNGIILKLDSEVDENNWEINQEFSSISSLSSINFFDSSNGITVGTSGAVIKYNHLNDSWYQIASPTSENLNCVSLFGPSSGWMVGNNSTIVEMGTY